MQEQQNFRQWFDKNLKDYALDIAEHGASAGFPYIISIKDCAELFDRFRDEIMGKLKEMMKSLGEDENIMSFVQSFNRSDMAEHWFNTGEMDDRTKNLLLWFMVEEIAHEYEREAEETE